MKILVTGASSGLARFVIPMLLDRGHKIVATSRTIEKVKSLEFFQKIKYIEYDFNNKDESNLYDYFQQPDILIHLAWDKLNDYNSEEHVTLVLESHKRFISNLIKHGLKDLTVIGTCYEYGLIEGEQREDMEITPVLPYSKAKNELRKYIEKISNQTAISFKWIRVFYMFGEIVGRKNLYTMLNQVINEKQSEFNMSGGEQIRDFLSPHEIAEIIINISLQKNVLGVINCCSGKPIKLREFVLNYLISKNINLKINFGVYPYADYEPMSSWGSTEKLKKVK